jgi:hypothetical protein
MGRIADKLFYDFDLHKLGYDFMGFYFDDKGELSYHHIIPRHYKGKTTYENGAILNRQTSHNYIHTIEEMDFQLFIELSQILRDEHKAKKITPEHLKEINMLLSYFEQKYAGQYTKRGNLIIKDEYVRRRVIL